MAAPILVLLVALPLLRPLRIQDPRDISDNELSRLAAIEAIGDEQTQDITRTQFFGYLQANHRLQSAPETITVAGRHYSDKPPVLAALLGGAYHVMTWMGLTMKDNFGLVPYLLTILGATIPVAASAGLIYRMGRLFELRRPWRTTLAIAVTFGTGLISYSVVINAHAPAAALVLGACACLIHISISKTARQTGAWLMIAGLCASLATVIDMAAGVFFVGLVLVVLALSKGRPWRIGWVAFYLFGAVPPLALHAALMLPVTQSLLPPTLQAQPVAMASANVHSVPDILDDEVAPDLGSVQRPSLVYRWWRGGCRFAAALVGAHGIFSHFPVLLVGLAGIGMVLRRHWPASTKLLAFVTLAGGLAIVIGYLAVRADWSRAMFGPRWFIVFLPLVLFWAGAWLRRKHHPFTWTVAGLLLLFSIAVSVLGATAPFLKTGADDYSAGVALRELLHPQRHDIERTIVAASDAP